MNLDGYTICAGPECLQIVPVGCLPLCHACDRLLQQQIRDNFDLLVGEMSKI